MTSRKDTGDQNINSQTASRENENIMLVIHSKVTNFILKQMDKQLKTLSTNLNVYTCVLTVIKVNQKAPSKGESHAPTVVEVNQKALSKDELQMNTSLNTNIVNQNIQTNGTIPDSQNNATNNCESGRSNVLNLKTHTDSQSMSIPQVYVAVPTGHLYTALTGQVIQYKKETKSQSHTPKLINRRSVPQPPNNVCINNPRQNENRTDKRHLYQLPRHPAPMSHPPVVNKQRARNEIPQATVVTTENRMKINHDSVNLIESSTEMAQPEKYIHSFLAERPQPPDPV
ncbi:hypothetical protein DPMN_105029 [Dreissena polymorpha]|uniref:Uncharacterized protein n=2 Tax=Dreissena polymorpha TaxID=45954 RepID=A0A9D4H8T8_DREPO|nr:hypothetical protein DPMN_105029 [Dreissena polymorpha]